MAPHYITNTKPLPQRGQVKKTIIMRAINATKNVLVAMPPSSSPDEITKQESNPQLQQQPSLPPLFTFATIPYSNYNPSLIHG